MRSARSLMHRSDTRAHTFNPADMPFLLKQYYNRFFPYDKYYQWLSYETPPEEYFAKREFSFTLKDDVYIRYQSFESRAEMEKGMDDMS